MMNTVQASPHINDENRAEIRPYSKGTAQKGSEVRPGKRGPPSTPLTPSLQQPTRIRRKLSSQKPDKNLISSSDSLEVLDLKFQTWLLHQELEKSQQLVKFMEMERKFALE